MNECNKNMFHVNAILFGSRQVLMFIYSRKSLLLVKLNQRKSISDTEFSGE